MSRVLSAVLRRDLILAFRSGGGWFYGLFFFAIFVALSGIAFGPELAGLRPAAPAAIWLALALSLQFSASGIFENELEDGSLKAIVAGGSDLAGYIGAKALVLAGVSAAPIIVAAPFALTMFGAPLAGGALAALHLLMGAPALIVLGVFSAALASGLRAGGLLGAIIVAPFMAPSLVFGVSATKILLGGGPFFSPETLILGAVSLFMVAVLPWFIVQTLKLSLE